MHGHVAPSSPFSIRHNQHQAKERNKSIDASLKELENLEKRLESELSKYDQEFSADDSSTDEASEENSEEDKVNEEIPAEKRISQLKKSWRRLKFSKDRLYRQTKDIESVNAKFQQKVATVSDQLVSRMVIELETGGNIRYEDGQPTDTWYQSCEHFMNSHFHKTKVLPCTY